MKKNNYALATAALALLTSSAFAQSAVKGYYREPVAHGDTLVFAAEGDLWSVPIAGGVAHRLTTHPAEETHPVISADGQTLAFTAKYEGPTELYTMPLAGGLPVRRTFEGESAVATTFTPQGSLVYATQYYSTLPDPQLVSLDLRTDVRTRIPLSQATEASYDSSGKTLYFVRPSFHNNVTRWYRGGTARQIWKYREGAAEAEKLTRDYEGESHTPMWWNNRVYFITDRDGTMNVWSVNESGGDLRQHTDHKEWDVRFASLDAGRIVYGVGADLWLYDIASNSKHLIPITLASDLDQLREKWVTKPMQSLTSAHLHPSGDSVVLTSRGRAFVAPARQGRLTQVSRAPGVRYRDVVFMPNGKSLLGLSDASGELEYAELPVNGVGAERRLTSDGKILRFGGLPSPDGKWIVYTDNNNDAWLLDVTTHTSKLISTNREGVEDFAWSPDSRYVTFSQSALNSFEQILLYEVATGARTPLTSSRVNSHSAAFSPDGKWLYFLSDRNLRSVVDGPWGTRQPEPYFDKPDKLYAIALQRGLRWPFKPEDELAPKAGENKDESDEKPSDEAKDGKEDKKKQEKDKPTKLPVKGEPRHIDLEGIAERLYELPVPAGRYRDLSINKKALFWLTRDVGLEAKTNLMALEITNESPKPAQIFDDVRSYELSRDGKQLLTMKGEDLFVFEAGTKKPQDLDKAKVNLAGWSYPIDVREDWRQMFIDAWRLERDYFYDPNMNGVDWQAVRAKYLPLVERITTREELSDVIGLAVGELSALHTAVRGGDMRRGPDDVKVPSLGARLILDQAAGGYRIDYIYRADPDYPQERSPLADPELKIAAGDVITAINGVNVLSVSYPNALLRNQAKRQVLLHVISRADKQGRDVIVMPTAEEGKLRYSDWELTRRERTDQLSNGNIGYLHLRAMTDEDLTSWFRDFYPVYDRQGLVIDARHNRGGNIDSFILARLLRKDWMYWQGRVGQPYTNMQYAFRGHIVVLVDEQTGSDGEAFAEGFRRLGLGKVIGTRTWGGEIWLDSQNRLTDGGFARAPMNGVYGPEGKWLIEQHGVDPDVVIDNLPHATFMGSDAQLETGVKELLDEIQRDPRPLPKAPPYPHVGPQGRH
jgi:tricorn protease